MLFGNTANKMAVQYTWSLECLTFGTVRFGLFDCPATRTYVWFFRGAMMGQIFKILSRRDFGLVCQWCRKFPPEFFTHFGHPTAENYDSVFLIALRPNGDLDRRATKTWARSFWPSCDLSRCFQPMVPLMKG